MQINSAFPQGPMNLLDRLKQAEAAATPGPWPYDTDWHAHAKEYMTLGPWFIDGRVGRYDARFITLLRNHAADLIRLVEAASEEEYWMEHQQRVSDEIKKRGMFYSRGTSGKDEARDRKNSILALFLDEEDAR